MANDTDMMNDAYELREAGQIQQADDLEMIYFFVFIEVDIKKAEQLKEKYIEKYREWLGEYWA